MNYLPEIEFSSQEKIAAVQLEKLIAMLHYLDQRSPFYQNLFREHGIVPAAFDSLDQLTSIPVTTKEDMQASNLDFLCVPKDEVAEYTSTSGTQGKPVTVALTRSDIERLAYNEAISFACAEGQSTDLYQLMLTLDRQFMAGLAYYEGIRKLGAGLVRVGPGLPAMQWETIHRLRPTALVAVPSFIVRLLDYAVENGIDYTGSTVRKIVCIGESIRDIDLRPNIIAQKITDRWDVKLYGTYASTEMQTAFTECGMGLGGHHHPELVIVEILDDQNMPVDGGAAGEVTITTLGVSGMPLLRYKTGDIARIDSAKCGCGRITSRLGPVLGRKQQMLKLRGTTVFPAAIFDVLNDCRGVQDYVVEVVSSALGTDELKIHAMIRGTEGDARDMLLAKFQSALKVIPEISFVDKEQLETLNRSRLERKTRRFIDSRNSSLYRPE